MTPTSGGRSVPPMKATLSLLLSLPLLGGALACQSETKTTPAPTQPTAVAAKPAEVKPAEAAPAPAEADAKGETGGDPALEAAEVFKTRCATCHGAEGKGDGAAAAALNPKPRSFADKEWQKTITDEHIEKIVLGGGPAVGKSPLMPPNPDLETKPAVVAALRAMVRQLGE